MRVLNLLKFVAMAGATAVASSAFAVPVVTQWTYQVSSVFVTNSCIFTSGVTPQPNTTCSPSLVAWGTQGPGTNGLQSSLEILGNPATGTVFTSDGNPVAPPCFGGAPCPPGSEIAPTQTFVHHNNPIYEPFLLQTTVSTTLTLDPLVPPGGPQVAPSPITFDIKFAETLNQEPCVAPSPPGNPCNDIFVLVGSLNPFDFFYTANVPGATPDHYFVSIIPNPLNGQNTPLQTLTHEECAAAGAADGCIGFTTPEGQDSSVQFAFFITTQPFVLVPEPGMLALFALGLVGLGLTLRRRRI